MRPKREWQQPAKARGPGAVREGEVHVEAQAARRLLIVEDEVLMSSLLRDTLAAAGFDVRVAANVLAARETIEDFDPDIALLDISLGEGPSGLDLAHVLATTHPDIAILFLTKHPDRRAAGIGSRDVPANSGFLRKDLVSDTSYLVDAIEAVLDDRPQNVRHDRATDNPLGALTTKQIDVLRMAAQGLTNAAIAQRRGSSERAVEMLMRAVFQGLAIDQSTDINPRVEAIRHYISAVGVPDRA